MFLEAIIPQAGSRPIPAASAAAGGVTFPLFEDIRGEFMAAAVVDRDMDTVLTPTGLGANWMETSAKANAQVLDAANEAVDWLALDDEILEIEVTTTRRVEFIRPFDPEGSMYLYAAFDPEKAKYADIVRMRVRMIELAFGL